MRMRVLGLAAAAWLAAAAADGQVIDPKRPAWGRVSFFGNTASTSAGASTNSFNELIGTATFESPTGGDVNYEYRVDVRFAGYPSSSDRTRRVSIYDAYAGVRLRGGTIGIRGGQMWLNELGGLGAVGGALIEIRQRPGQARGAWRAVVFGGLEPRILDAGYEADITKGGAFLAFDGAGLRRHVVGVVTTRNGGRTERSVVVVNNILPVGKKLFVYQAAEYDVKSAGVAAPGSLTYLFATARYSANRFIEIQGNYHRGRSIDSRTILRDQLDGRPIDPRQLDGLRFESAGGRVTIIVTPGLRVYGGYARDRNNHDEAASRRFTYGLFAANVFRTGVDASASSSRMERPGGNSFDSWYVSLGRSLTRHVYLSGDFGSSLSVLRFVSSSGFVIETRPHTRRLAVSAVVNVNHGASLLTTAERVTDGASTQTRFLSGVSYRF